MKVYGLRIGNTGFEFSHIEGRRNALNALACAEQTVEVSTYGSDFKPSAINFSMYIRETEQKVEDRDGLS